jgi:hypothetical protein
MKLIPLHEVHEEQGEADTKEDGEAEESGESKIRTIRLPQINTNFPPYLTICGIAFNTDKPKATFDIDAQQYTQFTSGYAALPVSCTIMNSPRWTHNDRKPTPFPNKYVKVTGFLTGRDIFHTIKSSPHKKRFTIDVDDVVFMGSATTTGKTATSTGATSSDPSTPGVSYTLHILRI